MTSFLVVVYAIYFSSQTLNMVLLFLPSAKAERQKNSGFILAEDKACNALHGKSKMISEHSYSIKHAFQDYYNHFQASSHVVQAQKHYITEAVQ